MDYNYYFSVVIEIVDVSNPIWAWRIYTGTLKFIISHTKIH